MSGPTAVYPELMVFSGPKSGHCGPERKVHFGPDLGAEIPSFVIFEKSAKSRVFQ